MRFPVPPGVVMRVTQAAADPAVGAHEIAAIIEQDPVLSAQVLRSVNSPYYSPRSTISSVQRAVSFMGINAVRNLLLCLAVQELFPLQIRFPLEAFWECSLRRGAAAKSLARHKGLPRLEQAFTMGLCQDLGVLLWLQHSPQPERYGDAMSLPARQRLELELDSGAGHPELGFELFGQWHLPEDLALPIRHHHDPDGAPGPHAEMARLASAAEALADLPVVENKQAAIALAEQQLGAVGLAPDRLSPILDEVAQMVTDAAAMLQIQVQRQPSFEEIAALASKGLLALNLSYQEMTEQLSRAVAEQQRMADQLRELNRELEARAVTDSLTSLPNRRAFDEAFARELARVQRQQHPLSLLLLDIDHFKRFNDTHGHLAGDLVLKEVASTIRRSVREADYPARFGGEEFTVVLPFTDLGGATVAAERIRSAVERLDVQWQDQRLSVTISIGVATARAPIDGESAARTIEEADGALYRAKDQGRNRVVSA